MTFSSSYVTVRLKSGLLVPIYWVVNFSLKSKNDLANVEDTVRSFALHKDSDMPLVTIVYWRDIPAQVVGRAGRNNFKKELEPRFAQAIDRAAMRAGRGSSDAYLEDWRRETEIVEGDIEALVTERVARLESEFNAERLEAVVKAGGLIAENAE